MISQSELRYLARLIRRPETLIFVGSGLSTWSGLPKWSALLVGLIEEAESDGHDASAARAALVTGNLLKAADDLPPAFRRADITRAMRSRLRFGQAQPHAVHHLLTHLGSTNFVTTNYDGLIEQQLTLDGVRSSYLLATSRRIAEMADIVKANSRRFVFKPHGDMDDAASIVLSSSHYAEIMDNPRNEVRRTLETLLLTRPVLFLGYSLNDPDTELLLRSIRSDFGGEAGELNAILPGVTAASALRRWDDLRVRAFDYPIVDLPNGSQDHSGLFDLLKRLVDFQDDPRAVAPAVFEPYKLLSMYTARYIQPEPTFVLPIQVHASYWHHWRLRPIEREFNNASLDIVIERFPTSFILEGPAGSGKSFSIARYLSRTAEELRAWLAKGRHSTPPPIPVLLDARLYRGNFEALAAATVPTGLALDALSNNHEIVLLVDSIDEMPAEYLEAASWRQDLEKYSRKLVRVRIVYGARRRDLIDRHELTAFSISALSEEVVHAALSSAGVQTHLLLSDELDRALRTPFVVGLARRFLPQLKNVQSAMPLYEAYIQSTLTQAFGNDVPDQLRRQLIALGVEVVGSGRDTLLVDKVAASFTLDVRPGRGEPLGGRQVLDHLVATGLFESQIDQNVRFVHRSVSEYLASHHIREGWKKGTLNLKETMSDRRWDDTFAFAAASMSPTERSALLRAVAKIDFPLSLRIAAVAETEREDIWQLMLSIAHEQPINYHMQMQGLVSLPETLSGALYELCLARDDRIGEWAAVQVKPTLNKHIDRILEDVAAGRIRYNCAQELSGDIGSRFTSRHVTKLREHLLKCHTDDPITPSNPEPHWSLVFPFVIRGIPVRLLSHFLDWTELQSEDIRGVVVEGVIRRRSSRVAKFLRGQFEAANRRLLFYLSLGLERKRVTFDNTLDEATIDRILNASGSDQYAFDCLVDLLRVQPIFRDYAKQKTLMRHPYFENAWEALFSENRDAISEAIALLLELKINNGVTRSALAILLAKDIGVVVSADLYIAACAELITMPQDEKLTERSLVAAIPSYLSSFSIEPLHKLTRFVVSVFESGASNDEFHDVLQTLIGQINRLEGAKKLAALSIDGRIPDCLLATVVGRVHGISTDDLDRESQLRLLPALDAWEQRLGNLFVTTLGSIATEAFIEQIALPYAIKLAESAHSQREMIEDLLLEAGLANGRRYYAPWHR